MHRRLLEAGVVALRGVALFLAVFTVIGIVGELRGRTLDVSLWWVDLRDLLPAARVGVLAGFAMLLAAWSILPAEGRRLRLLTAGACGILAAFAIRDTGRFLSLMSEGAVHPAVAIPLSLVIAGLLVAISVAAIWARPIVGTARGRLGRVAIAAAGVAVLFPMAQMAFFGTTDYRRPADVAVVFGARVYASGAPSPLLADRINTAIELYRSGLVPRLVMSGGDGADGFNEARVMRDVAIGAGVDPDAVIVDPIGVTTEATVSNVAVMIERGELPAAARVIAVSQAFHLPRVQLSFANAGLDVLTVPATGPTPIRDTAFLVLREVPAFWAYYLRVCLG